MFEDSTFESTGRIKTRSRRWMFAALILNGSILVALVLIPLIYPDALPSHFIPPLLVAPAARNLRRRLRPCTSGPPHRMIFRNWRMAESLPLQASRHASSTLTAPNQALIATSRRR